MKLWLFFVTFFLGAAGFAAAAEMKQTSSVFDWSGAYAGIHAGYGWGDSDFIDAEYNGFPPAFPMLEWGGKSEGFMGGIQAGYNWQRGRAVLGVEGEIGNLDLKGASLQPGVDPFGDPYDASGMVDGGWYGGLALRGGYAADKTLFFAKAGVVYTAATVGLRDSCNIAPCGNSMIDATEKLGRGVQWGGGVERAVADNRTIKAEYSYFRFGNSTITGAGVGGGSDGIIYNVQGDLAVHIIKAGLNYKF